MSRTFYFMHSYFEKNIKMIVIPGIFESNITQTPVNKGEN